MNENRRMECMIMMCEGVLRGALSVRLGLPAVHRYGLLRRRRPLPQAARVRQQSAGQTGRGEAGHRVVRSGRHGATGSYFLVLFLFAITIILFLLSVCFHMLLSIFLCFSMLYLIGSVDFLISYNWPSVSVFCSICMSEI